MKLIIKGRRGFRITPDLENYIKDRILKYEGIVKEPAICEVTLAQHRWPPFRGKNKIVHISLVMPGLKRPLFVKERTDDFFASIDLAQERLEHRIIKYKEKKKVGRRWPNKYWMAKALEGTRALPRWLSKRFHRE